jgi:hypothetical protein
MNSIIFGNLHTGRTSYEEHVNFSERGLIRFQLILKNHRLSSMVHTTQNLKTLNLNLGFEFQQLLVSLKHVINLFMWTANNRTFSHNVLCIMRNRSACYV